LPSEPKFVAARSLAEAVDHLASDEEAVACSGGTSIGLLVGQGLLVPSQLVWLGRVPGLDSIDVDGGTLRVGAMVTMAQLAEHPVVRSALPAVAAAAAAVGNPRVRAVATVGGALAHADPRQDLPPALLAVRAEVAVVGPTGDRRLPLADLPRGFMDTALEAGELVTTVYVPLVDRRRSCYLRFTPGSVADYPTVGTAASVQWDANGMLDAARVAVAGVAPVPLVLDVAVAGDVIDLDAAATTVADTASPVDDRLGSASYKRDMAAVWVRRALTACLAAPAADERSRYRVSGPA
jgi:carbon-monoxide dehydrogenase medium subunit